MGYKGSMGRKREICNHFNNKEFNIKKQKQKKPHGIVFPRVLHHNIAGLCEEYIFMKPQWICGKEKSIGRKYSQWKSKKKKWWETADYNLKEHSMFFLWVCFVLETKVFLFFASLFLFYDHVWDIKGSLNG